MDSRENFALITTANGEKSFLGECRSYNYKSPDILQMIAATRARVFNKLDPKSNYTSSNQSVTFIDYDPNALPAKLDIDRTLHTDASADKRPAADAWRYNTKHRSVSSRISCFANGFGEEVTPFFVIMTTGCSPNLMGTSPVDENTFAPGGKLDEKQFKETMKLLFKRWLMSQDRFKVDAVVLPFIGGGVYLKSLGKSEQAKARQLILEALKESLEESSFKHIKEVIFSAPDDEHGISKNKGYQLAATVFSSYAQQPGMPNLTVANVDIFDAADQIQKQGRVAGMINPGSDRTIGGAYRDTLNGKTRDTITLEELICNYTDTAFVQSIDFNQQQLKLKLYPQHLQDPNITGLSQQHVQAAPATTAASPDKRNLAREIANRINTKETVWIYDAGNNKKISFKNNKDAQNFVNELQKMGIGSSKHPNQPKTVQSDKEYFVVYLTNDQIATLSQQLNSPIAAATKPSTSTLFKSQTTTEASAGIADKDLAREIANMINTKETIWIYDSGENKKISFKNDKDAKQFVTQLHAMGIGSEKTIGKPKTVQYEEPFHLVYLSRNQVKMLTQKLSSTQSASHKQSWLPH